MAPNCHNPDRISIKSEILQPIETNAGSLAPSQHQVRTRKAIIKLDILVLKSHHGGQDPNAAGDHIGLYSYLHRADRIPAEDQRHPVIRQAVKHNLYRVLVIFVELDLHLNDRSPYQYG